MSVSEWSTRAKFVYKRTYSRPLNDAGTVFETWDDTVDRVIRHQEMLWADAGGKVDRDELEQLRQLILSRRALPAGRTLWLGGTDIARTRPSSQMNCSFLSISTVHDLVDAFWLLLQGCGVGFSPTPGNLSGFVRKMDVEIVRSTRTDRGGREENVESFDPATRTWTIRVGDSAVAWAKSIGKIAAGKFPAKRLVISFEEIRPAGSRLKGYGWICNGDASLANAYRAIAGIMNRRAGKLLSRIDILDITNWLGTVLSSRRSAQIALCDYGADNWRQFATAKTGEFWADNPQRSQSNNSIQFYEHPGKRVIGDLIRTMVEAGGSEPGIINAEEARRRASWYKGVNPCVVGETRILTRGGYVRIDSVVDTPVEVWNGEVWSKVTPTVTGEDVEVYKVTLSDGTSLICTGNHKWLVRRGGYTKFTEDRVRTDDLLGNETLTAYDMPVVESGRPFDAAYSHGFYCGDGFDYGGKKLAWLYGEKRKLADHLVGNLTALNSDRPKVRFPDDLPPKFHVPFDADIRGRLEWFAGLLDSDGTVVRSPNSTSVQITSVNREFLADVRLMLTTLGVRGKIGQMSTAGVRSMPDGRGGKKDYFCQRSDRLVLTSTDVRRLVDLGLTTYRLQFPKLEPNRDARRFVKVKSVEAVGVAEKVYCFSEPLARRGTFEGVVTGNCGEILLSDYGFCNLSTIDVAKFRDDFPGLMSAFRLISRANYRQTVVNLRDGVLQDAWHQNNEYLRLCGVSITGLARRPDIGPSDLKMMRNAAVSGSYSMADELGLERPKNTTTQKPEGSGSKALDTTEGCHRPMGRFIFNRVLFGVHDPLVPRLRDGGYDVEPHPLDPGSVLVNFPLDWSDVPGFTKVDGVEVNLEPAVDQLERYRTLMRYWCEQNVSVTVSYSDDEVEPVIDWLDKNWDDYVGISFLKRTDPTKTAKDLGYPYLPQTVVTEREYREYVARLKPVDVDDSGALEEIDAGTECAGGVCPVK
jgi:hypothetical protein